MTQAVKRSVSTRTAATTATLILAASAAVLTGAASPAAGLVSPAAGVARQAVCGIVFDDFHYDTHTDPALTANGWVPRGGAGGPGVAGTWSPSAVTFPDVDGDRVAQLESFTNGSAQGTVQSELLQGDRRFFEGTYASRIRFSDAPLLGPDGDQVVQTFFSISPLAYDMDPAYSELDFSEYLPNGGWGEPAPTDLQTSWYTYVADPWYADNAQSKQHRSLDGWHDVVVQVNDGHVAYFIDGELVADHSGKYYPRQKMSVNYNLWFINLSGHLGTQTSRYVQQIDWFSYTDNQVVSPSQAIADAAAYRANGVAHVDTLGSGVNCAADPARRGALGR